ncbi:hypothetical protein E4T44_05818, partial [Aureobasidium sp. EXF-8845]
MGPSKRKSRQMIDEEPEEPKYAVRSILDENKTKYLVDWEDIDGQSFAPTWEPKNFVTPDLIPDWEELKEQRKNERKSTASRPSTNGKAIQRDDEDEESTTASGSRSASVMKPSIMLKFSKQKPVVEVTPPAARVFEPTKKGRGRPRKSEVTNIQSGEELVANSSKKPGKLPVSRPRKSNPPPEAAEEEQDDDTESSGRTGIMLRIPKRKRGVSNSEGVASEVVNISSDEDSDISLRNTKRQRKIIPDSSDQAQPAPEEVQPVVVVAPRQRGRPRKSALPITPVVASRSAEVGTTEIEDSKMYDLAAAQLQRETRPARKQTPVRQPSPRQPSSEFDEDVSDFRSSQIVRGTQPEPARPEEQNTSLEAELTDSQSLVDAAAASSLSAKNSPYEPGATSGSAFDNTIVNSSSGVHTIPNLLTRRFGPDVVVPDSQSYLDGSSLHISEQRIEADQTMNDQVDIVEDASTESQIVVEPEVAEQMVSHDLPVLESSIAQKPEDAPQSDVAAPATQSEPSLERLTRNNTAVEAASSPVPQSIQQHVSTRSPSPVSPGAARSSSTSSAPPTETADKSTQSQSQPQNQPPSKSPSQNKLPVVESSSDQSTRNQNSGQNTVSVQPQATTQQSHVEQAAQEVSFQQPPTQQRPTFDFVQSSAEEVTTSSLRFDTQIPPTYQASAQHVLTQGVSTLSSPIASLPSNLPNTIGDSAPSPIKSLPDSGTSRQNTPASNMTHELNPDGTPKRESVKVKLARMRAANQARRDVEKKEAEQAAAVPLVTSTPTSSRITAPVLDMHSPKPASAVPARLMSPAVTEREARSPSTVPPVEIIPEETPEQNARSERYE